MVCLGVEIVRSVGDLPAYRGLGEGGFCSDLAGGGMGHLGEDGLNVVAESPDGNFFHGVAVGNGGLFEAVDDCDRGEAVNAGDLTVTVAEVRCEASAGSGDGIAGNVNAVLNGPVEEVRVDERVHLLHPRGVGGLVREAGV